MRAWAAAGASQQGNGGLGDGLVQEHGICDKTVDEIHIDDWVAQAGGRGMHLTMMELVRNLRGQKEVVLPVLAREPREAT